MFTNSPATIGYYFNHQAEDLFLIQTGDFNGDGKTDLLVNTEELESTIFQLDVENEIVTELNDTRFGYPNKYHRVFTGDFNSDGITDILTYAYTHPTISWELHFFNGKNAWQQGNCPITQTTDPEASNSNFNYIISDYNGDGKSDILEVFNKLDGNNVLGSWFNVYYSNWLNFDKESEFFEQLVPFNTHLITNYDFNGDGKVDCFILGNWSLPKKVMFFNKNEQHHLVKKIINGFGHESDLFYEPLTNNTIYTKGGDATYPLNDIQPAFNVVTQVDSENGIDGIKTIKYLYEGAVLHKEGKGFLGFEKLTTINNPNTSSSSKTVNTFELNMEYYFRWLKNSSTFSDAEANDPITEVINDDPEVKYFGSIEDRRFFYYIPRSLTKVYHSGDNNNSYIKTVLTKKYYSPDDINWGNLTSTEVFTEPSEVGFSAPEQAYDFYTKTYYYYNEPDEANWLISLPKRVISETWNSQDSEIDSQKTEFTYYDNPMEPNFSLLHTSIHIPNSSTPMTTINTYNYDDYGNITMSRLAAPYFTPHSPDRVSYFEYNNDYQHRFLTQTKNVLDGTDYITSAEYYAATGLTKSSTDLSGLTTNYFYDGFGRLRQTIYPDGVQDKILMFWSSNHEDNPNYGLYYTWTKRSGEQESISFADKLGRGLRTINKDFNNSKIYKDTHYNSLGQLKEASNSYYSSSDVLWTYYEYNTVGSVKKVISPTTTIEYTYDGKITTTVNVNLNIETSKEVNAIGEVIKATDEAGIINYVYFNSGNLKSITVGGVTTRMLYDEAGFQKSLIDPDAGTTKYIYNPFGELISQTDANSNTYEMLFDGLGRIKSKILLGSLDDIVNYTYCPVGTSGFGQLKSVSSGNGIKTDYDYDNLARLNKKTQTIEAKDYDFTYEYNVFGKTDKITWPSGFAVNYHYKNGYFSAVEQSETGNFIWELTDINAQGQIKQYQLGNGLLTTKEFDAHGFLLSIFTENNVQNNKYEFDNNTGNLSWRSSVIYPPYGSHTLKEVFTYDEALLNNRLKTWQVENVGPQYTINYNNNGNIENKSDVGTYVYNGIDEGPHAVSLIEEPNNAYLTIASSNEQVITYTGFNKIKTIRQFDPSNPEQSTDIEVTYGPGQSRCKTVLHKNGNLVKTKYFVGNLLEIEKDENNKTRELHYINAGDGVCAIYVIDNDGNGAMHYIHKDYLGSYEAITNERAEVVERLNFDPWGRRRNVTNWSYDNVPTSFIFDRGYTGHEHLDGFDLINMNGRVYDPMLGRFLSPDNYLQAPDYTQNFNRYSYCANNPLKYTDPSGNVYLWDDVIVAGVGFVLGYVSYGIMHDDWGWNAVAAGGIGAATALIGYYTFGGGLAAAQSGSALGELSAGLSYAGNMAINAYVSYVMPQISIPINDNFSVSVGPSVFFGDQTSLGVQFSATYSSGNFSFSAGMRVRTGTSNFGPPELSESVFSGRLGWDDGKNSIYGSYSYFDSGETSQSIAGLGGNVGPVGLYFENDYFTNSGDKYRTHAMQLSYLDYKLGLLLYTGDATLDGPLSEDELALGPNGTYTGSNAGKYRLGALFGGYNGFNAGWSSEGIRNSSQNWWHDNVVPTARFEILKDKFPGRPYFQYSTSYNFTLW